jgi:hypothetical protein
MDIAGWSRRRDEALKELSELAMALARDLAARAKAAKTAQEAVDLSLAFDRVGRCLRLTFALQSRLERDVQATLSEMAQARKKQIRAAITQGLPSDMGQRERWNLMGQLNERIDAEVLNLSLAEGPIEACIAHIRKGLGLPPEDPEAEGPAAPVHADPRSHSPWMGEGSGMEVGPSPPQGAEGPS